MDMKKQTKKIVWERSKYQMFESFANELQEFTKNGTVPAHADQDAQYCLELQQKRLKEKNLELEYVITPRGLFAEGGGIHKTWSDDRYASRMEYRTCRLERTFCRGGKPVFRESRNMIFYQTMTEAWDSQAVSEDLYACPNCGAIRPIGVLQKGCPYCGTHFEMSDLFPRVTSFYFIEDFGKTQKELKRSIWKTLIPVMLLAMVCFTCFFYQDPEVGGQWLPSILRGFFAGILGGAVFGYPIWAFRQLGAMVKNAGKAVPMLMNTAGSGKRFVTKMQKYSPEFSYEYFSGKVVSLLKMVLFSKDAQSRPIYAGGPSDDRFADLVDSSYTGAAALKNFRVHNGQCEVTVDVYLENIYAKEKRVFSKDEKIRVHLRRDVSRPLDLRFSVKQIRCRQCGGSFDAVKQRNCPHCGCEYQLSGEDWEIVGIEG